MNHSSGISAAVSRERAKFLSRSHDAVIRVYDEAGNSAKKLRRFTATYLLGPICSGPKSPSISGPKKAWEIHPIRDFRFPR